MLLRLDVAIDKVDYLSKDVEIARMEQEKKDMLEIEKESENITFFPIMVSEPGEYQYGGDAYAAAV